METRSNHVLVGGVVLAILAIAAAFIVWMANFGNGHQQRYDIFFPNSVSGLANGSTVTFSGVPVGKIDDIRLMPDTPQFVRVRISVDDTTPILKGTTATISAVGFTGVSQVNLGGAIKGAPPITDLGPYGVPVIPTKPGLVGQLLNSAPQLLEQLSTLTTRLGELLDDRNQRSIRNILANLEGVSKGLSDSGPELKDTVRAARRTIEQAGIAAEQIGRLTATTNRMLDEDGRPMIANLNRTIASARHATEQLDEMISEARPGVNQLATQTAPQIDELIRDLSEMAETLTRTADKLNNGGAASVFGGGRLPDYKGGR